MEFMQVVKQRQSIRLFSVAPVETDKERLLLETVNSAPSAGNLQAYELYVVRDAHVRRALSHAAGQDAVAGAPLVLVFCTHAALAAQKYGARGAELYCVQDATIACTYAMLAAADLGLASVWTGSFDEGEVHGIIDAPEGVRPVAMLPIGYAAETPLPRPRRALDDLAHPIGR